MQNAQELMKLARPAIIKMFGRQSLKVVSFKTDLIYANTTRRYLLTVAGRVNDFFVELIDDKDKNPQVAEVKRLERKDNTTDLLIKYQLLELVLEKNDLIGLLLYRLEPAIDGDLFAEMKVIHDRSDEKLKRIAARLQGAGIVDEVKVLEGEREQ